MIHAVRTSIVLLCLLAWVPGTPQAAELIADLQASAPKYVTENGTLNGICPDIYAALEEKLKNDNIRFSFQKEAAPFKRILGNLKTDQSQIFCGAIRNDERAKVYGFSVSPLYKVRYMLLARVAADVAADITSYDDLQSRKVIAIGGTWSAKTLSANKNVGTIETSQPPEKVLELMCRGRADYFFYQDLALRWALKNYNGPCEYVLLPHEFRVTQHWMIYSSQVPPDVKGKINAALTVLQADGSIKHIMDRYLKTD